MEVFKWSSGITYIFGKCLPGGFLISLPRNKDVFVWMFVKASWLAMRRKGRIFLHCMLTCDETWVHHYTLNQNKQAWSGRRKGKLRRSRPKHTSAGKVLATICWDSAGVLLIEFLHKRRTVNAIYYCKLLHNEKAVFHNKWCRRPMCDIILLYDNARPYTCLLYTSRCV